MAEAEKKEAVEIEEDLSTQQRTVKVCTLIPESMRVYIDPWTGYHVVEAEVYEDGDDSVVYTFLVEDSGELLRALRRVLAALESDVAEEAASPCSCR